MSNFPLNTPRTVFLFILLCWAYILPAQETKVVSDLHLWTGVAIEKSFAKDWSVFLAEEFRFKHDITVLNNFFTETGLRYRINKNFALEGQYRVTFDQNKYKNFDMLTRYALDLRYKGKISMITIYYRLRYQKEVEGWNLVNPSIPYQKYVRNRISVRYTDFKKIEPYVSGEIFQLFEPNLDARFQYVRVMAGILYTSRKAGKVKLAWGFNRELEDVQPTTIYTLKINYTYSF